MLRHSSIVLVVVCLITAACGQAAQEPAAPANAPQITLSTTRLVHPAFVQMRGSGFTPLRNALSHLKRSDGTEFPVMTILPDKRGEFTHEIDSLLLATGTHELWVIDVTTGVSSNVARFEVVRE
jgi:hypothetical protein